MPSAPPRWTNDDRQLTDREEPTTFEAWLWSGVHYGLAQVCLLTAPMLWLVFRTPSVDSVGASLKSATFVFVVAGALTISALRQGWVSVGRPWPVLWSSRFSFGEGYHALLRRSVLLSHLLGVVAFGSVSLAAVTGSPGLLLAVAAVLTVAGIALLPRLVTEAPSALLGRGSLYTLSLSLALLVGDPLTPPSRFRTAPAAFGLLLVAAVLDCRGLLGLLRRRLGSTG